VKRHPFAIALIIAALTPIPVVAQQLDPAIRTAARCAPIAGDRSGDAVRVIGATDSNPKTLYGIGDRIVIDAGTSRGIQTGQRYFVRRRLNFHGAPDARDTEGWVRILAVNERTSIASIEFACDGVSTDDFLEPYEEPVLPPYVDRTDATGELDFTKTARVMHGESGRVTGGGRDFMIIDRGQKDGIAAGARYAIFRNLRMDNVPPVNFAEAIIVSAKDESALIRITAARDAVTYGDTLVARIGGRGFPSSNPGGALGGGAAAANSGAAQQNPGAGEGNVPGGTGATAANREPVRSFTFEDVYFDFDRFTLRPEALTILDTAVKSLQDNATLRIQIEGYTCNIGTTEYNLALGERRASAVRDYLVNRGINASRLNTVSYGEERPKYDNAKEETRRLNRRAVLAVNIQKD
jgi:peptidoglycan-associated lipoprotein